MGLSRNKVAVSEGAAGSPPFYGERGCYPKGNDCRRRSLDLLFNFQGLSSLKVGVINAQGPPVPIPNTEVKLCSAENTLLATAREDRSMPTSPEGKPSGEHNRVKRGCSSAGRAPALQAGGHGFESHHLHHKRRHEHTA